MRLSWGANFDHNEGRRDMKGRYSVTVLGVLMFFGVVFSEIPAYSAAPEALVLENDAVLMEFEKENLGLASLVNKATRYNHINPVEGKHLLWEIALRYGTQERTVNNNSYPSTGAWTQATPDGGQRAILEWKDLEWWREKNCLTICITVDLPKEGGIPEWRITVDNNSSIWGLWSVKFPYVNGFMRASDCDIAIPFSNGGRLYAQCNEARTGSYPSGGWPSQFLCGTKDANSFYWAALDPGARKKNYFIKPGDQFYFTHFVEDMGVAGSDYGDYFPTAFGVYGGDWVDACKMYREWAMNQRWMEMGPVSKRTDMPDLIKNAGLWYQGGWEFGRKTGDTPHEMNEPMLAANERLGVPTALHWYNWHHMPFDNEYPHFLPPKPGFVERVRELVQGGMLIMPYINGLIIDFDNEDFKEFFPYTVKDETGRQQMHVYGTSSGRMTPMCASQPFWHNVIAGLVDSLTGYYGVNGVYIDQISAHASELCFDQSHGHPLGGGRWWVDGYQKMLEKVKAISVPRKAVITSENTAEPFMNKLDAFLTWYEPVQEDIPMLQMVYSGYTFYFGSPSSSSPQTTDRGFIMGQGRSFIWGHQNGWMGLWYMRPGHEKKAEYFGRIGKYRLAAKKFLTYGELVDLIQPLNKIPDVTEYWQDHSRIPRYATVPSAMGAVWKSEDNHLGIFIVNFLEVENVFSYRVDLDAYGIQAGAGSQYTIDRITPGETKVEGYSGTRVFERTEKLEPFEIKVLEVR